MNPNLKPQGGRGFAVSLLHGFATRSATVRQAAKKEMALRGARGWMSENISGVPAGRSVSHLTSPYIGLLARNN
jgi:hypothetical protein